MSTDIGNSSIPKRIAIMVGAGQVSGINAIVKGAALAAMKLGWEPVGIRDGFAGVLHPENYDEGGLITFTPSMIEHLDPNAGSILGQSARVDPFNVRTINEYDMVEEVDMSDVLIQRLKDENIDSLIGIVGAKGLSILYSLQLKGLNVVGIPRSIENEIAGTLVCFGFNTTLTTTIEMLDRARKSAIAARKIAIVEVQGTMAGWIALQAGIAIGADAILIPEMTSDLKEVAALLKSKMSSKRPYGVVVVAEGANIASKAKKEEPENTLKASLSPLATGEASEFVIKKSGQAAEKVARGLQLLIPEETYPLVVGPWARGSVPSSIDRQLGVAYGAAAVKAFKEEHKGVMVSFVPPEIRFIELYDAINKVRTIAADNEYFKTADLLGIYYGKKEEQS